MRYPKVTVLPLLDGSFFICVPLIDKEMERFERRLSVLLKKREERIEKSRKDAISFFTIFTVLSRDELEEISNNFVRKILKTSKRRGQG